MSVNANYARENKYCASLVHPSHISCYVQSMSCVSEVTTYILHGLRVQRHAEFVFICNTGKTRILSKLKAESLVFGDCMTVTMSKLVAHAS